MKIIIQLLLITLILQSCNSVEPESWMLVPYPNDVSVKRGSFSLSKGVDIVCSDSIFNAVEEHFTSKFLSLEGLINENSKRTIDIVFSDTPLASPEAYEISIKSKKVTLTASDPRGAYFGLMTIWQQLLFTNSLEIPCGIIKDEPRFEYRGLMLDESRHFFGKEKVMQLLDLMSLFKLNTFHWHLTDSPGWRIEIKAYPELGLTGGKGDSSNKDGVVQYYFQEDIKEIVSYAAERNISIIPEIDMPGHATAANRAYPEFSGGGSEKRPDFTFNPGKEETYEYLTTILKEVSELFPSSYIHFGGDEVHFGNQQWSSFDSVKKLMKNENLANLKEVEKYFSHRMADSISSLGKITAAWDEVVNAGLDAEKTQVYWWRHDRQEQLKASLDGGYKTVLCPRRPLYFDFVQHQSHQIGRRWDGFCPIEDVYLYPDNIHDFTDEETELIRGIQACIWSEKIKTTERLDFMTFPRMIALSEAAWTSEENKDYSRFENSLPYIFNYLDLEKIYYFNSLNDTLRNEPTI